MNNASNNANFSDGSSDRRQCTRVNFDAIAIISQGAYSVESHVIDISLNGVLLATPDNYQLKSDEAALIEITLEDNTLIEMTASLAHSSNYVLGFRSESLDMDSISHLRRLIELNIGGENAAQRVLEELLDSH